MNTQITITTIKNNLEHLSFQIFEYDGCNLAGLYCKESNRLYLTKGLTKTLLKRLREGKTNLTKSGGAFLSISSDCTYLGVSTSLIAKFS